MIRLISETRLNHFIEYDFNNDFTNQYIDDLRIGPRYCVFKSISIIKYSVLIQEYLFYP